VGKKNKQTVEQTVMQPITNNNNYNQALSTTNKLHAKSHHPATSTIKLKKYIPSVHVVRHTVICHSMQPSPSAICMNACALLVSSEANPFFKI